MAGCLPTIIGVPALALPLSLLISGALAQSKPDAQNYPVRPIRIIVPNPAGGPTDFTARAIAQRMTDAQGGRNQVRALTWQ
jgi:tripartite-type tricarboxylate transporter receptor subunit TctC